MVVGFPAGGGADAVSRIISARLSELLGQQVVVENKPGAGSNLALDHVANSPRRTATPSSCRFARRA